MLSHICQDEYKFDNNHQNNHKHPKWEGKPSVALISVHYVDKGSATGTE